MNPLDLKARIRDIPDFPTKGILFRDITPLLQDPAAFRYVVDTLAARHRGQRIDSVVAIEARGYIFGAPLAYALGVGFVPVRKVGKLPWKTHRVEYSLEYGSSVIEMHQDAVRAGQRVLIIDDLLATGGTLAGTAKLVERSGARVAGISVIVELGFLPGRAQLQGYDITSLVVY